LPGNHRMKANVPWDVELCSLIKTDRRFKRYLLPPSRGRRVSRAEM
jgi:hypothetical protein